MVTVFVLFVTLSFALGVSFTMTLEKTIDMATVIFRNENSILYRMSQFYFQYN